MTPKFLILACDGLWKAFGNEEAIKYVHELLGKAVKLSLIEEKMAVAGNETEGRDLYTEVLLKL
ncbi:hypothetical protein ANCCEY_14760 [Ancylostoma ceylanicum]|uniref:PPM-type phosphatase domain-containing protein n=1 Tax=Ancylostoma ceylanicum TaxID=53326 RepID=A0A0D6L4Z8_9BILA|nr:hypothetical protein ANCCEY_14760 [Ancylostoma ceylanicum]